MKQSAMYLLADRMSEEQKCWLDHGEVEGYGTEIEALGVLENEFDEPIASKLVISSMRQSSNAGLEK